MKLVFQIAAGVLIAGVLSWLFCIVLFVGAMRELGNVPASKLPAFQSAADTINAEAQRLSRAASWRAQNQQSMQRWKDDQREMALA